MSRLSQYINPSLLAEKHHYLRIQRESSRIGQYGIEKAVFNIRSDDGHENDMILFQELQSRNMTGSFSITDGLIDQVGRLTSAQLSEIIAGGMEILNHSMTHLGADQYTSREIAKYEILQAWQNLEDRGARVDGWVLPGGGGADTNDYWEKWGDLIQSRHLHSWGNYCHLTKPTFAQWGSQHHVTLDTTEGITVLAPKALATAVRNNESLHFLMHTTNLNAGEGKPTTADLQTLLDLVKTYRDGGSLEVLTTSGIAFATPEGKRADLLYDGDFEIDSLEGSEWRGSALLDTVGNYITLHSSMYAVQTLLSKQHDNSEVYAGTIWETVLVAKRASGSTGDLKLKIYDPVDSPILNYEKTFTLTDEWQTFRFVFSIPKNVQKYVYYELWGTKADEVEVKSAHVYLL